MQVDAAVADEGQVVLRKTANQSAPHEFATTHTFKSGGKEFHYKALAGEIFLWGDDAKPTASVFSTSYFKENIDEPNRRPIMFLFNGGPGSMSVWLHLAAFGPKRIDLPGNSVAPIVPPFDLKPNLETLLWHLDLVFVDPIGTGYSRALGSARDEEYWGVDEDAESLAEIIRRYLTKHKRWNSPIFLVGESYGTIRVSLLIRELHLMLLNNVAFNGVIFISAGTDVRVFLPPEPSNELPYITSLPTYAATAYYHNALPDQPDDFKKFIRESQEFAATDYLVALFQGHSISDERKREVAKRLNHFTGLDIEYLQRANLRIDQKRFLKELLRDRGQTIAVHDTRFVGRDGDSVGEFVEYDPFLPTTGSVLATAVNSYLSDELKVDFPEPYEVFSMEANKAWKRSKDSNKVFSGYLNTTQYLPQAAANNPGFRIFVASGYHDLTTTFFGAKHIFEHSGVNPKQVTLRNYDGGHMMYLHQPSRQQLSADIAEFVGVREFSILAPDDGNQPVDLSFQQGFPGDIHTSLVEENRLDDKSTRIACRDQFIGIPLPQENDHAPLGTVG